MVEIPKIQPREYVENQKMYSYIWSQLIYWNRGWNERGQPVFEKLLDCHQASKVSLDSYFSAWLQAKVDPLEKIVEIVIQKSFYISLLPDAIPEFIKNWEEAEKHEKLLPENKRALTNLKRQLSQELKPIFTVPSFYIGLVGLYMRQRKVQR